jgi:putative ABC transport system permease protein
MFFITYLGRELRRRMRQAIFIALGLALGVGLVITVIGASTAVKAAQGKVLASLYGVGTDLTVTTAPPRLTGNPGSRGGGVGITMGPGGFEICENGKCRSAAGQSIDTLGPMQDAPMSESLVAKVARLHGVASAASGLALSDNRITMPASATSDLAPTPSQFAVDGTDIPASSLGPLSDARLIAGRTFRAADADADVALVDSYYATAHDLKVGSYTTVANVKFKVIGILEQPQASSPPDVYIPLARAQALGTNPATGKHLTGYIDTIYVSATSATLIPAVQREIEKLLPSATVTSSSSLASEITGSVSSAAKLANDLGRWLAILVLVAAFAVASLLTIAAVSRRVQEFGTLKALGWRSGRIVTQVLGESIGTGIAGGLAGIGLGFAGIAIVNKVGGKLSATVPSGSSGTLQTQTAGAGPVTRSIIPATSHTVLVPLSASVTIGAIAVAVVLAVAGGLIAGSLGGWRAARLRPAAALATVA